jgi:metal-responsive CopG/Arc/MetJ family transcriptional regulator
VRVKTSITLPRNLLDRLDRLGKNRSALIEQAVFSYLNRLEREQRDRKDIEIINRNDDRLNREALDVLKFRDYRESR